MAQVVENGEFYEVIKTKAKIEESTAIIPVDIQSNLQETIQTHNAVSILTVQAADSAYIDCAGFDKIALNVLNDAATSTAISIKWSMDGVTQHGYDKDILPTASQQQRSVETGVKLRYAKIQIYNGDAATHVVSCWAYLKA